MPDSGSVDVMGWIAGISAALALAMFLGGLAAAFRVGNLRATIDDQAKRIETLEGRVTDEVTARVALEAQHRAEREALEAKLEALASENRGLHAIVPSGEQMALISTTLANLAALLEAHHHEAIARLDLLAAGTHDIKALLGARRSGDG